MSNIHSFSSREDIHEQACLWVSRMDRGLCEQEKEQLQLWLEQSQHHRGALFEVASLWDDLSVLNELSGLFPLDSSPNTRSKTKLATVAPWQIAASFLFMALAVTSVFYNQWSGKEQVVLANVNVQRAITEVGEQKNITLTDGSVVHLNTNSTVSIAYSDTERKITLLKGEAHFDVAHEVNRPFVVVAGPNTVTAVGTAFNVQLVEATSFELVVTEGKVLVQEKSQQSSAIDAEILSAKRPIADEGLLVFSGEKALVSGAIQRRVNMSDESMNDDLAWQQGMLVFKGEPLSLVLEEITRYTSVRFQVSNEKLKSTRVAGYFKVGDIDGLLNALKNGFAINSERVTEYTIVLSKEA